MAPRSRKHDQHASSEPVHSMSKTQYVSRSLVCLLASLVAAVAVAVSAGAQTDPVAHAAATCADYSNQAAAQQAADTRDADGDGVYCESLPCPCSTAAGGGGGGGSTPTPTA